MTTERRDWLLALCDGLDAATQNGDDIEFLTGYLLSDQHPELDTFIGEVPAAEAVRRVRQWASQAVSLPSEHLQNTPQNTSRTLAAERPAEQTFRTTVSAAEQGDGRTLAEQRAIELFSEGLSVRPLLERLKAEGLKIDRNKLKSLREQATL